MNNKMLSEKQSKLESMLETFVNIFVGFWISFAYWKYVVLPMIQTGQIAVDDTIYITSAFTVLAIVRQYLWRRFFANDLHKAIVAWVKTYYRA